MLGSKDSIRMQGSVAGDGELKENMMRLAGQLNITDAVEFAGLQSNVTLGCTMQMFLFFRLNLKGCR